MLTAQPDIHSGYGFAIGNMAAFDMDDPKSIVSTGGVGFDIINCGVRLLRTNLFEKDVQPLKEQLAQSLRAGNHYAEIQVVEEIFNKWKCRTDGHRGEGSGVRDDTFGQSRLWPIGGRLELKTLQMRSPNGLTFSSGYCSTLLIASLAFLL